MKIAIVENNLEEQGQLRLYIERYFSDRGLPLTVECYCDGEEIVLHRSEAFDVIFMDIDMERMGGMEAARVIRQEDSQVILIFVTNMAGFAIEGYSVQALDFLVKPVSDLRMEEELDKVQTILKRRNPGKMALRARDNVYQVPVSSVLYVEVYGRKLRVHQKEGFIEVGGTINHFEHLLRDQAFFRCHHGYLVNMVYVSAIEGSSVLVDGHEVPVSRQRKKAFVQAFTRYLGGTL